ncbi:MAG TPA: hypothetical protein VFP98_05490 [Candidatus Polarisedimenticolia bacterium]|nr:hypothetical protein [Candidatus Polarisedimenticolia bacterium]
MPPRTRARLLAASLLILLSACGVAAPTPFARSQRIPMGACEISVSHAESVAASTFSELAPGLPMSGKQILSVFFGVDGLEPAAAGRVRPLFMGFKVTDSEGRTYPGLLPMPAREYRMAMSGASVRTWGDYKAWESWMPTDSPIPREWVFLFLLPDDSRGLTVLIENPEHRAGQPERASIPLGR